MRVELHGVSTPLAGPLLQTRSLENLVVTHIALQS
jgi:hypothetical protein